MDNRIKRMQCLYPFVTMDNRIKRMQCLYQFRGVSLEAGSPQSIML